MATTITYAKSSSSSQAQQRWQHQDTLLDVLLPRYYEDDMLMTKIDTYDYHDVNRPFTMLTQQSIRSASASSRAAAPPMYDPELAMDDGSDALYTEALLNSEFAKWLGTDKEQQESLQALDRLRMMVAHITENHRHHQYASSSSPGCSTMEETSFSSSASSSHQRPSSSSSTASSSSNVLDAIQDRKGKSKARK
ncbi:hypothetical protein VTP01DRAFT_3854 [Rhizomucor pusillus]|uniref:uncharacterized protein n=1 Tax=Rhizomucor pusillus TaxID=4840 RepID=UPI0037424237